MDGFDELDRRLRGMTDPVQQRRRLAAVRCPVHHETPTNIRRRGTNWSFDVCCERLSKLAATAVVGF